MILLERTDCSDSVSYEDYVMNASKSSFNESFFESRHHDMPLHQLHIRCGERKVKPEYYLLMNESKHHMSENLEEVANYLFGHKEYGKWKRYKSDEPYDCNTLSSPSNTNRTEPYIEPMILSNILEEIMNGDSQKAVTYSNNELSLDRTGSFKVQSFNINGLQRVLPTLGIFAETLKSLAKLIHEH